MLELNRCEQKVKLSQGKKEGWKKHAKQFLKQNQVLHMVTEILQKGEMPNWTFQNFFSTLTLLMPLGYHAYKSCLLHAYVTLETHSTPDCCCERAVDVDFHDNNVCGAGVVPLCLVDVFLRWSIGEDGSVDVIQNIIQKLFRM